MKTISPCIAFAHVPVPFLPLLFDSKGCCVEDHVEQSDTPAHEESCRVNTPTADHNTPDQMTESHVVWNVNSTATRQLWKSCSINKAPATPVLSWLYACTHTHTTSFSILKIFILSSLKILETQEIGPMNVKLFCFAEMLKALINKSGWFYLWIFKKKKWQHLCPACLESPASFFFSIYLCFRSLIDVVYALKDEVLELKKVNEKIQIIKTHGL